MHQLNYRGLFYEENCSGYIARRESGAFGVRIEFECGREYQWNLERDPQQFGDRDVRVCDKPHGQW